MYKAIQAERLYERIVAQIEERILKRDLKAGDQLPAERELALQFGVSRTAVREAVKALREQGLVQIRAGRGTFISDSTSLAVRHSLGLMAKIGGGERLESLVEVREMLEPEIAALAATRMDNEHIAVMRDALKAMDAAMHEADRFIQADLDFHLALAEATQNPFIPALMNSVIDLLREQRKRIFFHGGASRGQFHHRRILEAVAERDPEAARQSMRAHLRQIRRDLKTTAPVRN